MIADKIRAHLKTADLRRVSIVSVAHAIHMHETTVRRKLVREGVSYIELLDAERRRRCQELLGRNPRADVPAMAKVTGYSGRASITRAMHRWFGVTLWDYRRAA